MALHLPKIETLSMKLPYWYFFSLYKESMDNLEFLGYEAEGWD